MPPIRVSAFIDGFNLYHAVADFREQHLKWLDLRKLCIQFAPPPDFAISEIYYFSAFAIWRADAYKRHKEYLKALEAVGVNPIMGRFKEKDRFCRICHSKWKAHEEKETDVNIAIHMLLESFKDTYDRLLLFSGDSDLAPAIELIRKEFPQKNMRIIIPAARQHSGDLIKAIGQPKHVKKMKKLHIERSLFGKEVFDSSGNIVATRPSKYDPPD